MEIGSTVYRQIEDWMTDVGRMSVWTKEVEAGLGVERKWDFAWDVRHVVRVSDERAAWMVWGLKKHSVFRCGIKTKLVIVQKREK